VHDHGSAATQNQGLAAPLFLYRAGRTTNAARCPPGVPVQDGGYPLF
jgi:hypothetical protein